MSLFLRAVLALISFITYHLSFINPAYAACNPDDPNFGPCPTGLDGIANMVGNILTVIVGLGFTAMLVLFIWAGIKYITSGGEPKAIQAAHQIVTWAFLGILFMALAWVILQLIAAFTGINDLTIFNIKALCGDLEKDFPFCQP